MTAFELTYQENYRKLYSVALNITNDKDAAADIVQEVFVSFFQKSKKRVSIKKPNSWLMKATINKSIDYSKRQKKQSQIAPFEDNQMDNNQVDILEKEQEREIIQKALAKLKDKERIIALLYGEGMSYKEISDISGVKLSSVGKTLSRALDKLEITLKKINNELY